MVQCFHSSLQNAQYYLVMPLKELLGLLFKWKFKSSRKVLPRPNTPFSSPLRIIEDMKLSHFHGKNRKVSHSGFCNSHPQLHPECAKTQEMCHLRQVHQTQKESNTHVPPAALAITVYCHRDQPFLQYHAVIIQLQLNTGNKLFSGTSALAMVHTRAKTQVLVVKKSNRIVT